MPTVEAIRLLEEIRAKAGPELSAASRTDRETARLAAAAMADLAPDVSAKWLAPAAPVFEGLIARARDKRLTDADLISAIHDAALALPEVFDRLGTADLAEGIERVVGAAMVNGALERQRQFEA